ncbi:MAG: PIN domain-containing protein [Calothrix sp. SM1_5_4]|nr:PIN domain-containing protein [Calothrix sp. SM1_5_4]
MPDLKFTKPIYSDPDDDKFLAAALSAKASYIVTGDKALLKLTEFSGAKIVQPSAFPENSQIAVNPPSLPPKISCFLRSIL